MTDNITEEETVETPKRGNALSPLVNVVRQFIAAMEKVDKLFKAVKTLMIIVALIVASFIGVKLYKSIAKPMMETAQKAGELKDASIEKMSDAKDAVGEKIGENIEAGAQKVTDAKDAVDAKLEAGAQKVGDMKDASVQKVTDAKDAVGEKVGAGAQKAADLKDASTQKLADAKDSVTGKLDSGTQKASDLKEASAQKVVDTKNAVTDKLDAGKQKASDLKDAAGSKAADLKDSASQAKNRLMVPIKEQAIFDAAAQAAFSVLVETKQEAASGFKKSGLRTRYLGGSEGKICALNLGLGNGDTQVFIAADNDGYEKSKEKANDKNPPTIRMVIMEDEKPKFGFNISKDQSTKAWNLRWNTLTITKPFEAETAQKRVQAILDAAMGC